MSCAFGGGINWCDKWRWLWASFILRRKTPLNIIMDCRWLKDEIILDDSVEDDLSLGQTHLNNICVTLWPVRQNIDFALLMILMQWKCVEWMPVNFDSTVKILLRQENYLFFADIHLHLFLTWCNGWAKLNQDSGNNTCLKGSGALKVFLICSCRSWFWHNEWSPKGFALCNTVWKLKWLIVQYSTDICAVCYSLLFKYLSKKKKQTKVCAASIFHTGTRGHFRPLPWLLKIICQDEQPEQTCRLEFLSVSLYRGRARTHGGLHATRARWLQGVHFLCW